MPDDPARFGPPTPATDLLEEHGLTDDAALLRAARRLLENAIALRAAAILEAPAPELPMGAPGSGTEPGPPSR